MNLSPGIYFSRIDFVAVVYDSRDLYLLQLRDPSSKSFVVSHFGEEYGVDFLENRVTRLKDGTVVEKRNITEVSNSGVSFEPFKL